MTEKDEYTESAKIAFESQDFDTAIVEYKRALRLRPDDPRIFIGLAQAYEKKGLQENEEVFLKMSMDSYFQALHKKNYSDAVLDGLIRLSSKLVRYDELVGVFKKLLNDNPENECVNNALKKLSAISLMSIPQTETSPKKDTNLIVKVFLDFILPLGGIFLLLIGIILPRYRAQSMFAGFSSICISIGTVLFLIYIFLKFIKTPSKKTRKNW